MSVFDFCLCTLCSVFVLCPSSSPRPSVSHLLLFHKVDVGSAFDLNGLTLAIVQSQHEVEEIGLPQVGRRLLLKVSAS